MLGPVCCVVHMYLCVYSCPLLICHGAGCGEGGVVGSFVVRISKLNNKYSSNWEMLSAFTQSCFVYFLSSSFAFFNLCVLPSKKQNRK